MTDKLTINVYVADRYYPLTVNGQGNEEKMKKAAKLINERVLLYQNRFRDIEMQDYLAMVCLHFATELMDSYKSDDIDNMFENLKKVDDKLGDFLKKT